MESHLLLRAGAAPRMLSARASASLLPYRSAGGPATSSFLVQQQQEQRRTKLTTARTKRSLNIPPHPSFLESGHESDRIVFNPPSSEASPHHTPFKFLPPGDPRRRAGLAARSSVSTTIKYSSTSPIASSSIYPSSVAGGEQQSARLPPTIAKMEPKPSLKDFYNVTAAEVAEMRRLRAQDPVKWSVVALAKKFNTTNMFVMIAAGARTMTEHRKKMQQELEEIKERWGPKRTKARADRAKRRQLLFRGEL